MADKIHNYLSWVDVDNQLHTELLQPDQGNLLIGRSPLADIEVINTSISRKHLQLCWHDNHLQIKDLGSTYGTWIENVRLTPGQYYDIDADTEIRLGNLSMWYELRQEENSQALLQTCFHPKAIIRDIELSTEINTFRARLQQHLQTHLVDQNLGGTEALTKAIDRELLELNATQANRLKEQHILHSISHMLNRSLTLLELTQTALKLVSQVLNAERGFVLLHKAKNRDEANFEVVGSRNFTQLSWSTDEKTPQCYSAALIQRCYVQNKVLIVGDTRLNKWLVDVLSVAQGGSRCIAVIPLQQDDQVIGVLYLDNQSQTHCFDQYQIPFLKTFAAHTAIALNNAMLYKRAITDDLTQLYTRQYIDERLAQEIQRAQRYQHPFTLLLMDLDHFKLVNDNHGHTAGDQVLKTFSAIVHEHLRDSDMAGRFGGEEFIVILADTDLEGGMVFAERIRAAAEQASVIKDGHDIAVTVSIGVASYQALHGDKAILLIEDADEALYQAKQAGRNKAISYQS